MRTTPVRLPASLRSVQSIRTPRLVIRAREVADMQTKGTIEPTAGPWCRATRRQPTRRRDRRAGGAPARLHRGHSPPTSSCPTSGSPSPTLRPPSGEHSMTRGASWPRAADERARAAAVGERSTGGQAAAKRLRVAATASRIISGLQHGTALRAARPRSPRAHRTRPSGGSGLARTRLAPIARSGGVIDDVAVGDRVVREAEAEQRLKAGVPPLRRTRVVRSFLS